MRSLTLGIAAILVVSLCASGTPSANEISLEWDATGTNELTAKTTLSRGCTMR